MGLIMKNGISYGGGSGGSGTAADTKHIDITQAEYDELQSKGLVDSTATYFVIDGEYIEGGGNANIVKLTQAEYDALPESKYTDGILYAITDGESSSGGGTSKPVELTKAQYEALGDSVLTDGILYAITDGDELYAKNLAFDDTETQLGANNVQDAISGLNSKRISYYTFNPEDTSVTATEKVVSIVDGRKFSDCYLVTFAFKVSGYWRNSITIPVSRFKDSTGVSLSYVDTNNVVRYVDVKYVSETSYSVKCSSNFEVEPYLIVFGNQLEF